MSLPIFQSKSQEMGLMQTSWAQQLNPIISLPISQGSILTNVPLATGPNTINHLLGRKLQGWWIVRQRSSASIFDTQDNNQMPNLTLLLTASSPVSVDIFVF